MLNKKDFFGYDFEVDYNLFGDQFQEAPGIYIIYTAKACLDIGSTKTLKTSLETHPHTAKWITLAEGEDILVALYFEDNDRQRENITSFLRSRMHPLL